MNTPGVDIIGAVVGLLTIAAFLWGGSKFLAKINELLDQTKILPEVKASADTAADEWRGATAALREYADGHDRRLRLLERAMADNRDALIDHAERLATIETAIRERN